MNKDPVLPPSSGTTRKGCVCGYPSCNGAEAYEHLVNKPRTDDPDFRRAPVMMPSSGTFLECRGYELGEGPDDSTPVTLPHIAWFPQKELLVPDDHYATPTT
ncbi:hypothetical protein GCK72_022064 [Caenorhabditis remanei]|uniref:Uncharacterized protein n=1 Tax=Caenorhabditis remanei TaxID=31234 RepID=A0A6A5FSR2_CAERE|nr:hypothetical protein GCK72_022064 [Caenorhabditis remanei]KAF1745617.1 hypothetical protein GCK72_022064 [Caenorhabditis remanei]